jgi:Fe2+ transport system protein FeoA
MVGFLLYLYYMNIKEVIDIPENNPCNHCTPCLRLRLMEMGFIEGQKINIHTKRMGLWIVDVLSENEDVLSTYALRPEELDRICLK